MLVDQNRLLQLNALQKKINIQFSDVYTLNHAFIHPSYTNEKGSLYQDNNQRLEFLGDSVLELAVSEYLYRNYDLLTEGQMTKVRAITVCEPSLARVARQLGLGDYLILGRGEENTGGRNKNSILADTFEALIGAIYIDLGFRAAKKYFYQLVIPNVNLAADIRDFKTILQEYVQGDKRSLLYRIIDEQGPSHDKSFTAAVYLDGEILLGQGIGKTKKEAEQKAAEEALKKGKFNVNQTNL